MMKIWRQDEADGWEPATLAGDLFRIRRRNSAGADLQPCAAVAPGPSAYLLRPADAGWCLLAPADLPVRINGLPLDAGLRVLADRDEILLPATAGQPAVRLFFSAEEMASVEPLDTATTGVCPRCSGPIEVGTPAVRCPHCHVWHHQSQEWPCWSYSSRCGACQRAAAPLEAACWNPAEL